MDGLVVLLPCFNEEQALPELLKRLATAASQLQPDIALSVLVVDDGSGDRTAELAAAGVDGLAVQLVRHPENRGLGAALRTGIAWFLARPAGADQPGMLAVMDADGTHPPELLPRLRSALAAAGNADVAIASRYAPGGEEHGLPALRLCYSRLTSIMFRLLAPVPGARDYSCGYRLYRRRALERAQDRFGDRLITENSFVCMAELLIKLGRSGARIAEVPLELHYELKAGASKMNVPATIRRYIALAWHVLFSPGWR
ncbi:glycosyltransferase [bacterium]|nr:glycosyltransferase [bacterium]